MQTHLARLRGINVSGHRMIKMDALKIALEKIGLLNVRTYLQSGNVFVDSDATAAKIGFVIKQEIQKTFGHDVPVVVISKQDLEFCIKNNPYLVDNNVDIKKLYVAFVSTILKSDHINNLQVSNFKPDESAIDENRIFIKYDVGAGKTRLDQNYIEKKLNVVATIRNWNSIINMLEIF